MRLLTSMTFSLPLFFWKHCFFTLNTASDFFFLGGREHLKPESLWFYYSLFLLFGKELNLAHIAFSILASSLLKLFEAWIQFIILLLVLALSWLYSLIVLKYFTLTMLTKISLSYLKWEYCLYIVPNVLCGNPFLDWEVDAYLKLFA